MKKILFLAGLLALASCQKDPQEKLCEGIICNNGEYLSIVDAIDLKFGSADNPFEEFVFDFDWHLVPLSGSDPRKWIPEDWETLCRHFSATYTMIFR
jgi:hypothetical protein